MSVGPVLIASIRKISGFMIKQKFGRPKFSNKAPSGGFDQYQTQSSTSWCFLSYYETCASAMLPLYQLKWWIVVVSMKQEFKNSKWCITNMISFRGIFVHSFFIRQSTPDTSEFIHQTESPNRIVINCCVYSEQGISRRFEFEVYLPDLSELRVFSVAQTNSQVLILICFHNK